MIKICIIILNYRTADETINCIKSLQKLDMQDFHLLIADICDLDDSRKKLSIHLEKQSILSGELINIDHNPGFAGANNIAISYCLSKYNPDFFWLLNNDTVVDKSALSELVSSWHLLNRQEAGAGFLGSRIMRFDQLEVIEHIGDQITPAGELKRLFRLGKSETPIPERHLLKVDFVIGASMFFHCNVLKTVGLMDEDYFLYYEDVDWCYRAIKNGFQNYTCTKSVVYHRQGSSTGTRHLRQTLNPQTGRFLFSSYIRFFQKNYPSYVFIARLMLFRQLIGKIVRGRSSEAKTIAQALLNINPANSSRNLGVNCLLM